MAWEFIELNICPTGDKPVFHAAQYDIGRPIIIKLKNGEDDFTPTDLDIELQVRKVDNNVVTAVPDSVDGNVVTFLTTEQMTACSGTNLCEVQLTAGDNTMATLHFYLVVQRDALQGGLSSQSEIHDLEEQIAEIVPSVIGDEYYTAEEVDEKIAEIPTFDPSNYYDKTQLYTKTETNGLLSQKANTSSLSAVAFSGSYTDLSNTPTIPDFSNYYTKSETYNQTEVNNLLSTKADTSSLSTVATTGDYDDLLNKPTIPAAQVQSDWDQSDNTQVDYIKNKPTIPTNSDFSLSGLSDTDITTPSANQVLAYDGSKWGNTTLDIPTNLTNDGYAISSIKIYSATSLTGNLNTLLIDGIYQVGNIQAQTNYPAGVGYSGCIKVLHITSSYIVQEAICDSGRKTRWTFDGGTTWGNWY